MITSWVEGTAKWVEGRGKEGKLMARDGNERIANYEVTGKKA